MSRHFNAAGIRFVIAPGNRILTRSGSLILWGICALSGTLLLGAYHARSGDAATPPLHWPSGGPVTYDHSRSTLLIFLHPLCPCSRASLSELTRIMAASQGRLTVHAWVLALPSPTSPTQRTGIEGDLLAIQGINVHDDSGGQEARRFGVATSGQVLLFDTSGSLVFSGGITSARGHEGESHGRAAVLSWISGEANGRSSSPVFGCPLATPGSPRDVRIER